MGHGDGLFSCHVRGCAVGWQTGGEGRGGTIKTRRRPPEPPGNAGRPMSYEQITASPSAAPERRTTCVPHTPSPHHRVLNAASDFSVASFHAERQTAVRQMGRARRAAPGGDERDATAERRRRKRRKRRTSSLHHSLSDDPEPPAAVAETEPENDRLPRRRRRRGGRAPAAAS